MKNCSKCGAENLPGAKFCQMCASSLVETGTGADVARKGGPSLSTTVVFSIDPPEKQVCPICEAVNDGDWAFCQQCGSKLSSTPVPAGAEADAAESNKKHTFATTIRASQLAEKLRNVPATVACPKCSQQLVAGAAFCHTCGAAVSATKTIAMSSFKPATRPRLLLIVDGEATGDEFEITRDTIVGRVDGDITFPHDDYMSGRHATILKRGDKFLLSDENSRNGSFVRIKKEVEIKPGDYILLGKQLFRFEI